MKSRSIQRINSTTLNKQYMTTDHKPQSVRYYIIKSTAGLMVMKVALADIDKFYSVFKDQIMACGITLADVLTKEGWTKGTVLRDKLGEIPGFDDNQTLL